jgi:hypothetical protein
MRCFHLRLNDDLAGVRCVDARQSCTVEDGVSEWDHMVQGGLRL